MLTIIHGKKIIKVAKVLYGVHTSKEGDLEIYGADFSGYLYDMDYAGTPGVTHAKACKKYIAS